MEPFLKPLSAQEEKSCLDAYQRGDTKARDILVERNLRLVAHVVKKYQGLPDDLDDLISIGTIGLIKAVNTYRERYEAVGLFENRVYPGIRRLLRTLHRDGWYIGIATGKPQRSSERIIEHFGLNRYITKIVGPKDGRGADKELLIRQALPEDAQIPA